MEPSPNTGLKPIQPINEHDDREAFFFLFVYLNDRGAGFLKQRHDVEGINLIF